MSRRSTVRRVEEFALFDVLCEDGTRTLNRKSTGSELVDIEVGTARQDLYRGPQIAEISGKPPDPIKSLTRMCRR